MTYPQFTIARRQVLKPSPLDTVEGGLLSWWPLIEHDGSAADDIVGVLPLTIDSAGTFPQSAPSFPVPGTGAYDFNDTTHYLKSPNTSVLTTVFSVSAWTYLVSVPGTESQVFHVFNDNFGLSVSGATAGHYGVWSGSFASGGTATLAGVWYHVCGTWDATTQTIYLNGVSDGSGGQGGNTWGANDLFIGNRDNGSRQWPGYIADVRLYRRALTAAEVNTLYLRGVTARQSHPDEWEMPILKAAAAGAGWGWHQDFDQPTKRKIFLDFTTILPGMPPYSGPTLSPFHDSAVRQRILRPETWDASYFSRPTGNVAGSPFEQPQRRFRLDDFGFVPRSAAAVNPIGSPFDQQQRRRIGSENWDSPAFAQATVAAVNVIGPAFDQQLRRSISQDFVSVLPPMPPYSGPPVAQFEDKAQSLKKIGPEAWNSVYFAQVVAAAAATGLAAPFESKLKLTFSGEPWIGPPTAIRPISWTPGLFDPASRILRPVDWSNLTATAIAIPPQFQAEFAQALRSQRAAEFSSTLPPPPVAAAIPGVLLQSFDDVMRLRLSPAALEWWGTLPPAMAVVVSQVSAGSSISGGYFSRGRWRKLVGEQIAAHDAEVRAKLAKSERERAALQEASWEARAAIEAAEVSEAEIDRELAGMRRALEAAAGATRVTAAIKHAKAATEYARAVRQRIEDEEEEEQVIMFLLMH